MSSRRLFLYHSLFLLAGCAGSKSTPEELGKLVIGIVAYGEGVLSVERYQKFVSYMGKQTQTIVELEPAFNEVKAIQQIQRQVWSLVFAPPGLAAIATQSNYLPLFPLQDINNNRSVLIVLKRSTIKTLKDLNGKVVALGEPGSATSYYVPLYNLYGLTLAEIRTVPTPRTILEAVAKGEVVAGALSIDEFKRYRADFLPVEFRTMYVSNKVPSGAVLINSSIGRDRQNLIVAAMNQVEPQTAQQAGYIPNAPAPKYQQLVEFINKVKPIETHIHEKPASLYQKEEEKKL